MNRALTIASPAEPRVLLRAAGTDDLDDLRRWKNAAKTGFFFKGEINEQMQGAWFAAYLERQNDYMFVIEHEGKKVGCLGFRLDKGAADVYNVIAAPGATGKGLMTAAMLLLCSHIGEHHTKNIGCLVLKGNEALAYYERCGFRITGNGKDHDILTLDWATSST